MKKKMKKKKKNQTRMWRLKMTCKKYWTEYMAYYSVLKRKEILIHTQHEKP